MSRDRYIGFHFSLTRRDYERAIADNRRFFSYATGAPPETADAIKSALKSDRCVVSREATR
jgi:hypothetical protein